MNSSSTLLIVDDDPYARATLGQLLGGEGFTLLYASRGDEALRFAAEYRPDLILLDVMMPALSGFEVCRQLRANRQLQEVAILMITSLNDRESRLEGLSAGADGFIAKPFDRAELLALVRTITRLNRYRRLLDEQARLGRLIQLSPDGIAVLTAEGGILIANTALLRLLDIADVADLVGQNLYDYISPGSYDRYRSGIDQLLSDHQHTLRIEITLQSATKQLIPVEISVGRFSDFDGADLQMIVRDITERKLAEAKIQRHVSQLTSLHAIGVAITASLDLRTTLDVLIERMLEHLGTDAAGVLLINQRTGLLEPAVSRGPRLPLQKQYLLHADEGLPGIACLTRRSVSISRISPENLRCERDRALSEMFASYFAVPLLMGNDVLGVIEIMHQTPFTPDQHWWVFLDALAMQAAIAINTATLFAQLQQANSELTHAYNATIEGWSRALDLRDRETEGHSVRVTELALQLAKRMNLPPEELDHIRRGALLHDIGKMGVPDRILLKPGPLNADEWQVMRQHPIYAYEWLSPIPFLQPALAIPYAHHERWDGSGYPRGLRGEQIPLMARIFAVVDVWDALRSVRPYRLPWSEERVMTHIYALSDSHFDPQVVKAFLDLIQEQAL